jgi:chemotaxis protein histidine kinase CheA
VCKQAADVVMSRACPPGCKGIDNNEIDALRVELAQAKEYAAHWMENALGHIACEQHTATHVGEMVECPFCVADRLRAEMAQVKKDANHQCRERVKEFERANNLQSELAAEKQRFQNVMGKEVAAVLGAAKEVEKTSHLEPEQHFECGIWWSHPHEDYVKAMEKLSESVRELREAK